MDERNREVYLNFGMICWGPLSEIEKLQKIIENECHELKIVYQTVSARRLYLVKRSLEDGRGRREEGGVQASSRGTP